MNSAQSVTKPPRVGATPTCADPEEVWTEAPDTEQDFSLRTTGIGGPLIVHLHTSRMYSL